MIHQSHRTSWLLAAAFAAIVSTSARLSLDDRVCHVTTNDRFDDLNVPELRGRNGQDIVRYCRRTGNISRVFGSVRWRRTAGSDAQAWLAQRGAPLHMVLNWFRELERNSPRGPEPRAVWPDIGLEKDLGVTKEAQAIAWKAQKRPCDR